MKSFSKIVLAFYLLMLSWLVLCKFSVDIPAVLDHQRRGLNLLPFVGSHPREMVDNLIVFIPFGLLLGVNLKQCTFGRKLMYISAFSVAAEVLQYALAIGVADITDVFTNTLGGLLGLALYDFSNKHTNTKKQDGYIVGVILLLMMMVIWLRFFVFRVRY